MSHNCNGNDAGSFAIGALVGAVIGGVAALLLAPQSGEETRKQIKSKAQEARVRADLAMMEGRDLADDAGDAARDMKRKAHHLKHEAKNKLEDMRDGDNA